MAATGCLELLTWHWLRGEVVLWVSTKLCSNAEVSVCSGTCITCVRLTCRFGQYATVKAFLSTAV